ncbi:uncharacterized protein METZ01_LOCUS381121, partial [marine metagenome]
MLALVIASGAIVDPVTSFSGITITTREVILTVLVSGDAEVSTPAIGAFLLVIGTTLHVRARLIYRHAEWTIWAKALLHVVRTFLHVRARLIYRHAEWT